MNKKIYVLRLVLIAFLFSLLASCTRREDEQVQPSLPETANPNLKVNAALYALLKEWYLWNDHLPQVDVKNYDTPEKLLDVLRYKGSDRTDKWSYIEDAKSFDQYFSGGQYVGYGFGMKADKDGDLRVSFVYKGSPMDRQGVTRGYKLVKVNGKDVRPMLGTSAFSQELGEDREGVQTTFSVQDLSGNIHSVTIAKEAVSMNTVLHRDVREVAGKKVGYLVFNTFIAKSKEELDEAFSYFRSQGVSEVVLDLRYNGGGSLQIAQHLASLIAGGRAGEKFVELSYNSKKQGENERFDFQVASAALSLNRLFVITSRSSASASEAIINGLRPYMPVLTIGDRTSGKPVGMNIWKIGNYAVVPITFVVNNNFGKADYFDGILADGSAADDLDALLGNGQEDCLQQALHYIQNGSFSGRLASGRTEDPGRTIKLEGFRAEIGAF